MTGLGATSSLGGQATSGGVSVERLKLRVAVALGSTVPTLTKFSSWIAHEAGRVGSLMGKRCEGM